MTYDFSGFKKKAVEISEHLSKELSAIHTGRASSAILDGIFIESYGAQLAIPHVATIANEDARTLRIVPWDKANGKEIEKALKGVREQSKNDIIETERDGGMSEDEKTRSLEELQKLVDEANNSLESIGEKKEKEILGE